MFSQLFDLSNYYLNPYAIPIIIVGIFIFFISLFVLRQNRHSTVNIAFFVQCFAFSLWLLSISVVYLSRSPQLAMFWYRYFTFFGVVNIMPSVILFAITWSGKLQRKKTFVITNYIISWIFYLLVISTDKLISPYKVRNYFWGHYPVYPLGMVPYLIFFFWQYLVGFYYICAAYKSEKVILTKMQRKMIAIASFIAVTASVDFLPKFFNIALYPYGYIPMFIYISIIAYSIVRYKTFDIETVIHKTIMWMLSFSFIVIPIFFLYRLVLPNIKDSSAWQITFWIANLLFLAFYLRVIQPKIDHIFQRRTSNLKEISSRFADELVHLKEVNQLIQRIEDIIKETLYPQRVDIFVYNEDRRNYKLAKETFRPKEIIEFKGAEQFLVWLAKNNKIVYREFIDLDPAFSVIKEKAKDYFNLTRATVVIPLALNENLLGIINLAKKSNLKRYTAAEFNFLNTLKNQSTIALSNSLLYKNMEERVQERTKELVGVQKQLIHAEKLATVGTLAGGVAHEINNPLTAILTNVQLLLASGGTNNAEPDKESLQLIEEATKRCRTIVQKLMAYAKKPLAAAKLSTVNLLDVVRSVDSFVGYQLKQDNINLIIDETKEDSYLVAGNHNELEQVLTNLILNAKDAIKQIKKGGEIRIAFSKTNDGIKMTVKDEGIGIAKEIIPKIFDPFFTTKDVGKGTGLGLSICQAIIEKHNGLISVQSEPHKGSVFTVQLPRPHG